MSEIIFSINGKQYKVDGKFGPDVSLNEYIRSEAGLRGTKAMCHEGGCGACVVAARAALPPDNQLKTFAVNSCLVSVFSCHGWEVTTVEGIGNRIKGYHDIQSRLAKFNGTQCGYCTPGWVMNMYSLYKSKDGDLTSEEIENSFASNMCRCTGYRPIADAFKTFAKDADQKLLAKLSDIEELDIVKSCGLKCAQSCSHREKCCNGDIVKFNGFNENQQSDEEVEENFIHIDNNKMIVIENDTNTWYRAYSLSDVFEAMRHGDYKLVAGNTGQGVNQLSDYAKNVIDIFNVADIKGYNIDVNLILGAGMTLSDMMELFLSLSEKREEFAYLKDFYNHMDLVAHIPVRNIGTIGGNLYLKHLNNEFQTDLFLLFETIGGLVTIAESVERDVKVSLTEFLKTSMEGKIIKSVVLPPLSKSCYVKSFKIMCRSQNTHAIVNAGFLFEFKQNSMLLEKASIVYGGISESFVHAEKTEELLKGKDPYTDETLQLALKSLHEEVNPVEAPPEPSAAYRRMLAVSLYYKAILSLCPSNRMNSTFKSGGEVIKRHTSKGMQSFETDETVWPLNQPIPKLEALVQCSGEATFANDLEAMPNEVFAAYVTADVVPGSVIKDFDTSEAFKLPGVIAFYTASDFPGDNVFTPSNFLFITEYEAILCDKQVLFHGQPAGIIVAEREKIANLAAKLVKINYTSISQNKPLLTIDQVLKSPEKSKRVRADQTVEPTDVGTDVKEVVTGELELKEQYHFHMETQTCVARPTEDGMEVYSSAQWIDVVNVAIAKALNIPVNSVNVVVRRLGGAYGGKIIRSAQIACSTALVTHLLNRPCRMILPLITNMKSIGKRIPTKCNIEAGVNAKGEIQYLKNNFYQDGGCSYNEVLTAITTQHFLNCYNAKRWYMSAYSVLTDKTSHSFCRAPSSTEGVAMIEYMMEKIAFTLKQDPIEVRLLNMDLEDNPIPEMITQIKKDADYDDRCQEVEEFNKNNRWRKRAIKMIPISVDIAYYGGFNATVSIYHGDGSVVVTHGGVEMGQGINTKTAQTCAYILGIPLDKISVKPSSSFATPNTFVTGASVGSESVVFAAKKACEVLNERLKPIRESLDNPTWADLIIEGAFIMGLGYWTSEQLIYDGATGKLLTDRTWNYKIPGIKDIPSDMRIYFRRNAKNELGVLQSKATGEPSTCLATVFLHAAREAVRAARLQAGYEDTWFDIDIPCTTESIFNAVGHKLEHFTLK
ncbi:hypothetical protein B5X24_HaOG210952 [Helicoverpa armigera]|nr:hypothetical protein B5X24_HaOG210952 [Helicoverpa armigera]